ncbi:hypothetical protein [uncultured Algimonas sp.]|uniref:hypothetical protein n=1 Tax=uncultured Algimonas sp. TaxID=1547920 RepID=UPI002602FB35|nr:hypothetical protein [uncultured Algimonas sp.]
MTRRHARHSRQPLVTENEIALEWELKRTRKELAQLRRQHEDANPYANKGLSAPSRLDLVEKIAKMWENCALHRVPSDALCPHCGGMTREQVREGWMRWVAEEESIAESSKTD